MADESEVPDETPVEETEEVGGNPSTEPEKPSDKKMGCGFWALMTVTVTFVVLAVVTTYIDHNSGFNDPPTISSRVADELDYWVNNDGTVWGEDTTVVPLSETSNGVYGREGNCRIKVTYRSGGYGLTEFATAFTNTQWCRVSYAENTVGYFNPEWYWPDQYVTYTTDDPGFPLRAITFAACAPPGTAHLSCTVVVLSDEPS